MTSKKTLSSILLLIAVSICLAGVAAAQEITGSIVGTVKDSAGAVVPGASVIITDPSKNDLVVRNISANEDGEFSAPNIPIGTYSVTVEAPNFKKAVSTGITVEVGQRRQVEVSLVAGNVNEVVTVAADQVSVELSTPTVGTTLNRDQIQELSINNRNFIQLVTLAPGVSSNLADQVYVGTTNPEGQANIVAISVNGARQSQNTYTVDGADITDRGSNITIQAYPSVDSICQYKVLRSLYPAESGRSGGGQVNVVGCGGTNEFHGSFFEFVRNEKFNASSFLNNRNFPLGRDEDGKAIKAPFRYNNFGLTFGGPVYFVKPFGEHEPSGSAFGKIPRTFFFYSHEQRIDRRSTTLSSQVPDANLRAGIFSVPICLSATISATTPVTRTCTQILPAGTPISSVATINPVSQQYVQNIFSQIPLPNNPPYGLLYPASAQADFSQHILKFDTSFSDDWTASYRYQRDKIPTVDANSLFSSGSGIPGVSTSETDSPGRLHTLQTNYVVTPNVIVEGRYVYAYGAIISNTTGLLSRSVSNISVPMPYSADDDRIPQVSIGGFNALASFGPYNNFSDKHEYSGSLTWVKGSHTMKFGGSFSKYRKNEDNGLGGTAQGAFSGFNNTTLASPANGVVCVDATNTAIACPAGTQSTQQNWANFLLGTNASFTQTKFRLTADFRQRNVEGYAQDEFRFRQNLTFYLGVRYSFFGSPWAANGLLSNFDPLSYNRAQAPQVRGNGERVSGTGNFCNGIVVNAQNYTTGPASFECTPIASPRGQYIVDSPKKNFAPRVGLAWDPFKKGTTSVRTGYGIFHDQTLLGHIETHLGVNPPYQETITVTRVRIDNPVPGSAPVTATLTPPNLIRGIDVDYKTPYMQHWSLDVQHQFDRDTIMSIGYYGSKGTHLIGIIDINNLPPGYAATQQCATGTSTTPTVPCQPLNGVTGLPNVFTSDGGSRILDQLRPYKGWRGIAMVQPRFNSNYHSLQFSGTRKFGGSSQVQLAYTWAKNLTDNQSDRSNAPMNSYDISTERSRAFLDRRHVTTLNYIYELPWYSKQQGLIGKLLGGWQASGIITYQTGLPLTPTFSAWDPSGIGFLNPNSPAGGRPFVFGNPNEGGQGTFEEFFNYSVFQNTAPGSALPIPGNAGRGIINGPRTFRVDFTVTKNFRFSESMRLQLRAEAFNLLNTVNFTTISLAASTPHTINATTGAHSGFGTVTGTRDPRTMQFGAKFSF